MRKVIWLAVLVIAAAYVAAAFATLDRRGDAARVDSLIARGTQAVRDRNVIGAVSCISTNYRDEAGIGYDRLRILLAQAMRTETNYTLTTSNPVTTLDGDQATVTLHVTFKHPTGDTFYDRDITLELAKENATHMLIIPTKRWRVVGSRNLELPTTESLF
jgi:hypothetical protein